MGLLMTVLAVLNQKGGSGKTTTAIGLAGELTRRGRRVLIVDTDPQQSASNWRAGRERTDITVVAIQKAAVLQGTVPGMARDYDVVIVDGAGSVTDVSAAAISVADVVVIPCQPTAKDIQATAAIVDLVKARQALVEGRPPAAFLVCRSFPNTRAARDVDEALLRFELPVLESRLSNRQVYATADLTGSTVTEAEPTGDAAKELAAVVDELIDNGLLSIPIPKEVA
jgi:chromosome partitioning protein